MSLLAAIHDKFAASSTLATQIPGGLFDDYQPPDADLPRPYAVVIDDGGTRTESSVSNGAPVDHNTTFYVLSEDSDLAMAGAVALTDVFDDAALSLAEGGTAYASRIDPPKHVTDPEVTKLVENMFQVSVTYQFQI